MFRFNGKDKEAKAQVVIPSTVEEVTPSAEEVAEHKSDFHMSANTLEEARAGRQISDIPLNDPYWQISNAHTMAHGAHAVRVDPLPMQKKVDELTRKGIVVEKV